MHPSSDSRSCCSIVHVPADTQINGLTWFQMQKTVCGRGFVTKGCQNILPDSNKLNLHYNLTLPYPSSSCQVWQHNMQESAARCRKKKPPMFSSRKFQWKTNLLTQNAAGNFWKALLIMSFPQKLPPAWLWLSTEDTGQNHPAVFLQHLPCIKRHTGLGCSHLTWLWHSCSVSAVGPRIFTHWPAVAGASPGKTFLPQCCHASLLRWGSAFCSQARASFCPYLCCRQLLRHAMETSCLPQPSSLPLSPSLCQHFFLPIVTWDWDDLRLCETHTVWEVQREFQSII